MSRDSVKHDPSDDVVILTLVLSRKEVESLLAPFDGRISLSQAIRMLALIAAGSGKGEA